MHMIEEKELVVDLVEDLGKPENMVQRVVLVAVEDNCSEDTELVCSVDNQALLV